MNASHQYVDMLIAAWGGPWKEHAARFKYPPPAMLIAAHGVEYNHRRVEEVRGEPKACFANAQVLASVRKDLTYVEGYAYSVIPVEHAWCVDAEGYVVDPTWDFEMLNGDPRVPDYFGIPFPEAAIKRIRKQAKPRKGWLESLLFTWWKWDKLYPALRAELSTRKEPEHGLVDQNA